MASSYTSLLGLVLPVQGELQGTWGDTVNNELTSLLDTAIAGTTTLSTDADVTLTDTDGTTNQARQQIILWTATGTTTRNITAPAQSKTYVVINATGGTQSIVIRGVGPTTGVTVAAGDTALVAWDGSDFVNVQVYPGAGIAVSTGTAWGASKTTPTGDIVGTTDTQTLTNKTISADSNTLSGIAASSFVLSDASGNIDGSAAQKVIPSGAVVGTTDTQTLTNKTTETLVLNNGYTEEVYAVSGTTPALSPLDGSIQTWTLSGNSTPTAGTWASGQSITLMVDDGTAYTITWSSLSVTWKTDGGSTPTLNTSGYTVISLWKVSSTIYGARVGDA
jgi:hypothetical protein